MKITTCQVKSQAVSWDDLIDFAKAKIRELQDSLRGFEESKKSGKPWPGTHSDNQNS
jgi:hypothetical protein